MYHQNNWHNKIDTCSTYEFGHEFIITNFKDKKQTYNRFQLINAKQEPHQTLERFYSRLRVLGSKGVLGPVEDDLVKDFFIGKMSNTNTTIQKELLLEVRTPSQALNFVLRGERGQQNKRNSSRKGFQLEYNNCIFICKQNKTGNTTDS